jgi:N-acetylneuraminic acid mutarotase
VGGGRRLAWRTSAIALALALPALAPAADAAWRIHAPLPVKRTEVAAATVGTEIVVVGGYAIDGSTRAEAYAYAPIGNRWRRLPDAPIGVNHPMAAGWQGRLYLVGGYPGPRPPLRAAFVLEGGRWRALAPPPEGRAAAGAAVVSGRLYVVGGVGPSGLARQALVYDIASGRWGTAPGPMPREHLAVTSLGGRIYAIAGRLAGLNTNLTLVESWAPGEPRWRREPAVPRSRGGTGAAAVAGQLVSVGGEEPAGTIASVFAYDPTTRRWRRLPDLPTPRHGLGVAALGGRVYAIAGGERPGLFVSAANQSIAP